MGQESEMGWLTPSRETDICSCPKWMSTLDNCTSINPGVTGTQPFYFRRELKAKTLSIWDAQKVYTSTAPHTNTPIGSQTDRWKSEWDKRAVRYICLVSEWLPRWRWQHRTLTEFGQRDGPAENCYIEAEGRLSKHHHGHLNQHQYRPHSHTNTQT